MHEVLAKTGWCHLTVTKILYMLKPTNIRDCALAEPGGPWRLTFSLGRLENLLCCAPWILEIQSTGLPSIFLRAQPFLIPPNAWLPLSTGIHHPWMCSWQQKLVLHDAWNYQEKPKNMISTKLRIDQPCVSWFNCIIALNLYSWLLVFCPQLSELMAFHRIIFSFP